MNSIEYCMSKHAHRRSAQRAIRTQHIAVVLEYGYPEKAGTGVTRYHLDSNSCDELIEERRKEIELLQRARGVVVVADGIDIITVYPRKSNAAPRRSRK